MGATSGGWSGKLKGSVSVKLVLKPSVTMTRRRHLSPPPYLEASNENEVIFSGSFKRTHVFPSSQVISMQHQYSVVTSTSQLIVLVFSWESISSPLTRGDSS